MRQSTVLSAALLAVFIVGCKPSDAPPASSAPGLAAQAEEPAKKKDLVLSVDPAEMPTCDKTTRTATVRWDANSVTSLSPPFEVWVSYPGKEPRLFARSPAKTGEVQTGKWIVAGAAFSLKNSDGSEVANVEVTGVPCN